MHCIVCPASDRNRDYGMQREKSKNNKRNDCERGGIPPRPFPFLDAPMTIYKLTDHFGVINKPSGRKRVHTAGCVAVQSIQALLVNSAARAAQIDRARHVRHIALLASPTPRANNVMRINY